MEYLVLAAIRRLIHTIRCYFPRKIFVEWRVGPSRKVPFAFLLNGPSKYFNEHVAQVHGELVYLSQLLQQEKLPPQSIELLNLYHELLNSRWMIAAPIIPDDLPSGESERWCFIGTTKPDETLLANLLDAAKRFISEMENYWKNLELPPPEFRIDLLHKKLEMAGLPVVGCAAFVVKRHSTESPATFFEVDNKLVRIDWSDIPSQSDINNTQQIIDTHAEYLKRRKASESLGTEYILPSDEIFENKRRLYVEDIESIRKVREIDYHDAAYLFTKDGRIELLEDDDIKFPFGDILGVNVHQSHNPGEMNDLYADLVINGNRYSAAFLLKGRGERSKFLQIKHCGEHGDQIVKLFDSPASVFIVQYVGSVSQNLIREMDARVELIRSRGQQAWFCIIDGVDTARILHAYGKLKKVA